MTLSEDNQKDILAYIMLFLFILVALYFTTSCKVTEYLPGDTVRIENIKTVRDSIVFTKIDSAGYDLLFECDSNNQVILKEFNEYKTKGFKTSFTFKDNRLQLKALIDSLGILHRIIDNYQFKEVIKVNPINEQLKSENYTLELKLAIFKKIALGLGIALLLIGLFWWIKRKLKFVF